MTERLAERALAALPAYVRRPEYERAEVAPGIVHLGLGAFHRAHQAVFTDDCLAAGETNWGIVGASLRSPATRDALAPQDNLYTLAVRSGGEETLRVIGALSRILVAPEVPGALLAALADSRTRIVTLTVTEKFYAADGAGGSLPTDDPDILHDLANPGSPRSALGFITEALSLRRSRMIPPFTLVSCDNLPSNGRTLRTLLAEFAALRDPALARHIADEVAFPSTMVDRIVPATTDSDRASIAARLGVNDAWPVVTEPFWQWVVEDEFPLGRPGWERGGITFVNDVAPFEQMKLRMLNGAHTAVAAIARIAGLVTVADAVAEPTIRRFVEQLWAEVAPTLSPHLDPDGYAGRLLRRFDKTALRHLANQIARDASRKLPPRILAPLRELRAAGHPTPMLVHAVAAWIRSCAARDESGGALELCDPLLQSWRDMPDQDVASPSETVQAFLSLTPIFGADLPRDAAFALALSSALSGINRLGILASTAATLRAQL